MKITTLCIDIAKSIFQLIGLGEKGHAVMRKKMTRTQFLKTLQNIPACKVAMEACGSANQQTALSGPQAFEASTSGGGD